VYHPGGDAYKPARYNPARRNCETEVSQCIDARLPASDQLDKFRYLGGLAAHPLRRNSKRCSSHARGSWLGGARARMQREERRHYERAATGILSSDSSAAWRYVKMCDTCVVTIVTCRVAA